MTPHLFLFEGTSDVSTRGQPLLFHALEGKEPASHSTFRLTHRHHATEGALPQEPLLCFAADICSSDSGWGERLLFGISVAR